MSSRITATDLHFSFYIFTQIWDFLSHNTTLGNNNITLLRASKISDFFNNFISGLVLKVSKPFKNQARAQNAKYFRIKPRYLECTYSCYDISSKIIWTRNLLFYVLEYACCWYIHFAFASDFINCLLIAQTSPQTKLLSFPFCRCIFNTRYVYMIF